MMHAKSKMNKKNKHAGSNFFDVMARPLQARLHDSLMNTSF